MEIRQKQPAEKLAYTFDFAPVIASTDTVSSIVSIAFTNCGVVAGSTGLTLSNNVMSGRMAQTTIQGGTDGESYYGTCKVIDSAGQQHELDGLLEVIEL
jgi:hypothetical protein